MEYPFLRIFIPTYCVIYVAVCFVGRWYLFKRTTGKNPIILGSTETAHGYIAFIGKVLVSGMTVVVLIYSNAPSLYQALVPIPIFESTGMKGIGAILLMVSLCLTALAQAQMRDSWRVGIETNEKTEIVRRGFYRFSRNPIYLGMIITNVGFFILLPNAVTLVVLVLTYTILQIIVRLEEAHLRSLQGERFIDYCSRVRRWI